MIVRLPEPHKAQSIFFNWSDLYPEAQCLVAPCGTKVGKTYGGTLWMLKEALLNPGIYCAWIAPTYLKCRIAYRYFKAMLPDCEAFDPVDGRLEIKLANGAFIKFLHGRDAEVTVEGEAVDRFVIDEAGKINRQVWYSLFTTITQTKGFGIVTGTPRGFTWYYELFKQAQQGDKFFCWAQIKTKDSPFITEEAIANAKRLLPAYLYDQYYNAMFLSQSSTFGDLSTIWDEALVPSGDMINPKLWLHPDDTTRNMDCVHGIDIAKQKDYTVFYSINMRGQLVGYARFNKVSYPAQIKRVETYMNRFFNQPKCDNIIRYDATGIGQAFGDMLAESNIDAAITPIVFTNKSKSEMVTRATMAIEEGWHKAPRIERIEHEFASYELKITKSGLHSFSAPEGEHDDVVSAAIMAISAAYQSSMAEDAEKMLEKHINGNIKEDDHIANYAAHATYDDDDFFDQDTEEDDEDFDKYLEEA